jgi:L-ribulose-5-phosphate 4-epimerase
MFLKKKKECHLGNIKLLKLNLVFHNFGNLSLRINKDLFVIKPSGVDLENITFGQYPLIFINSKKKLGNLKPSVDTDFHLEIYKNFPKINSIVHTHSKYATIWAQACMKIPIVGTTHADYWDSDIEVTKILKPREISSNYELNIGRSVVRKLKKNFCNGLLIANHGAITFGQSITEAIKYAERLEFIAEITYKTIMLNNKPKISISLVKKHYLRKNGQDSYYGQNYKS